MKALLILGCDGRQDKSFHFCHGVENTIVDFESIVHKENYLDLIKYLDDISKLFDAPCCVNNIIVNTIYRIYDMNFIDDKKYAHITNFVKFHIRCGLILKIIPM
jgi:hypothetical protein